MDLNNIQLSTLRSLLADNNASITVYRLKSGKMHRIDIVFKTQEDRVMFILAHGSFGHVVDDEYLVCQI